MSKITVSLANLPAMPRNRSHALMRGKLIKTSLARAFEEDLKGRLEELEDLFEMFRSRYDKTVHAVRATAYVYTPADTLWTKKGTISENSVDGDAHKLLWDCLSEALQIDDAHFADWRIVKMESPDEFWNYTIIFETYSKAELSGTTEHALH